MIELLLRIARKFCRLIEVALYRLRLVLAGRRAHVDGLTLLLPADVLSTQMAYLLLSGGIDGEDRRLMRRHGRPGDFLLNLGGGSGLSAMAAYRCIQPGGRVLAVEPDAAVLDLARRNFELNGLAAIATVRGAAVADPTTHEVTFYKKRNYYGSNLFNTDGAGTPQTVPAVYPPDLLPKDWPGRKVLLCDIEGVEAAMLAKPEIVACFDLIMVELHMGLFPKDAVSPYVKMFDVLDEQGFRVIDTDDEVFVFARQSP